MTANDLIEALRNLIDANPDNADLLVKFRTNNQQLISVDDAQHMADTFGAWIELA
jgi:hypothetical protein